MNRYPSEHCVKMIGARYRSDQKGEDRNSLKSRWRNRLDLPEAGCLFLEEPWRSSNRSLSRDRPSQFHPGRTCGGVAYNIKSTKRLPQGAGIEYDREILVEESVLGWKEFELEVMAISMIMWWSSAPVENFDPWEFIRGQYHGRTAQTLTDKEYQDARCSDSRHPGGWRGDRRVNIQFAIRPRDGRMVIIEMNPRVSRSSALARRQQGFDCKDGGQVGVGTAG